MDVVIRVDASLAIGSGHLMRCLTLANALRARGSNVTFICREHQGHLCKHVEANGFRLCRLPAPNRTPSPGSEDYAAWRGVSQEMDAEQTLACRHGNPPANWLVVDHYGLDAVWERRVRELSINTLVIDDIANRPHDCHLLLDQNLSLVPHERYRSWVPAGCRLLLGPRYALLRDEFSAAARQLRTRSGHVKRILIFFGGTDLTGETLKSCRAVARVVSKSVIVDVVVGATNPYREEIEQLCRLDDRFRYHRQISNMAELIRDADLGVGAGGISSWERTFLELPTLTIAIAENQVGGSEALAQRGAIRYLGTQSTVTEGQIGRALKELLGDPEVLVIMAQRCREIHGSDRVSGVQQIIRAMDEVASADV